ncbi:MAG: hypothetical protein E7635_02145 [Ruminococcaceae bacterium]|nr:hypothetical protein [Oscillospiraceae bacterium]
MTSNMIKLIACISMFIDHAGLQLFDNNIIMRSVGRLAMPLFAFFIGEGCRHTSNRLKYFLRVFVLGVICQIAYTANEIASGSFSSVYLNILFTFSISILICFAYLNFEESKSKSKGAAIFLFTIISGLLFDFFCISSERLVGVSFSFDYGIVGALLPFAAVMFKDRSKKLITFTFAVIMFTINECISSPYSVFALLSLPIIYAYNGKRGHSRFKYGFYIFYPLHLALIYLISLII